MIAFSIGISAAIWKLNQPEYCPVIPEVAEQNEVSSPTSSKGKVEVRFLGFSKRENRSTLKFSIINNSADFIKYSAIKEGEIPTTIKSKGDVIKRLPGLLCGITDEFTIKQNETVSLEIFADLLMFDLLEESGNFEFGFTFYNQENINLEGWSEPLKVSEKMKKDIIKNAPAFLLKLQKKSSILLSQKQLAALDGF
ncbi:MAG: hypothetical protein AAB336_11460 [Acidobacteriota bacterium]